MSPTPSESSGTLSHTHTPRSSRASSISSASPHTTMSHQQLLASLSETQASLAVLADSLNEHTFSDLATTKLKLAELESTLQTHTATITALEARLELVEKKASILGVIAAFPTNVCSFLNQNGETILITTLMFPVFLVAVTGGLALSRRISVWGLAEACR